MARTPLFSRLQDLYRDFAERDTTGQPVVRSPAASTSRRDFLKIAAAGTAGALAWPARPLAGPAPRIAIVGGGIAGLNAALALQDAGFSSTIYEAASRVASRSQPHS